jgi:hypothetical protein
VTAIRPLRRDDLPQVASLIELVYRSGSRVPPPGLVSHLEKILLNHPWADAELPSLVYVDRDGAVKGFLGLHVRRMMFDGRPIRVACGGQLATEPAVRGQAAGALLVREYLRGPQDLSLTDSASEIVQQMWERFGGETVHLQCIGWVRLFRPWRFASEFLFRERKALKQAGRAVSSVLDPATSMAAGSYVSVRRPDVSATQLTPRDLAATLPKLADRVRLRPDYDEEFLAWLFQRLAEVTSRGTPVGFVVRDGAGRELGWYMYFLQVGGISRVLGIAANARSVGSVLDHLLHHAQSSGSAGLQGRLEPELVEPLSRRRCLFHSSGYRVLIHSSRPEILCAIQSGAALLTRLDGDYWMGIGRESFL